MEIKSIKQAKNLAGKVVLLRVDFNAPMAKGRVADNYKIIKYLPTIKYLLRQRAKVVLMSHWGNPEFTKQGVVKQKKQFSLLPVFKFLSKKLPGKYFSASRSWARQPRPN